jgi:hypothetical protein
VALGLPVAVAVGWNLAVPVKRPAAVGVPGGEGVLGAAPTPTRTEPVAVRYSAQPYRPRPSSTVSPSSAVPTVPSTVPVLTVAPPSATPSPEPSDEVSELPLPPLGEPPVPTPTDPSDSSASPPDFEPPSSPPGSDVPPLFP